VRGRRKPSVDRDAILKGDTVSGNTRASDKLIEAIVTGRAAALDLNLDDLLASGEVDPASKFLRENRGRLAVTPEISEG
jgi:hypothetical protein